MDSLLKKLKRNQRKGSKPRCHWLTHGTPSQVASQLTALTEPWGSVSADDCWMPEGFDQVEEAQLHRATKLLRLQDCEALGDWWLSVRSEDSQTPSWDIASTCTVEGRRGLLLVEAKAHTQELKVGDRAGGSRPNQGRIARSIEEANAALAHHTELDWALSHEHRYQMANRFAWSWKLTEFGYPVILVYLGFLRAEEMRRGREQTPFESHSEWEGLVKVHSEPLFPEGVWDRRWIIHGRPFVPRIFSMETPYDMPMQERDDVGARGCA